MNAESTSIGTTPFAKLESIVGDHPKVKITRLFSTAHYEHAKFEITVPLPQGKMGKAIDELNQALCAMNPALQPHDALTQLQYKSKRAAGTIEEWEEKQISLYEQWEHGVAYARQVLDSYTEPEPLLNQVNHVTPSTHDAQ